MELYLIKAYDPATDGFDILATACSKEDCDQIAAILSNQLLHDHLHVSGTTRRYTYFQVDNPVCPGGVIRYSAYWGKLIGSLHEFKGGDVKAQIRDREILRETDKLNAIPFIPEDKLFNG